MIVKFILWGLAPSWTRCPIIFRNWTGIGPLSFDVKRHRNIVHILMLCTQHTTLLGWWFGGPQVPSSSTTSATNNKKLLAR